MVLIPPGSAQADATLRFFNADGGEVESCGNATRCVARLLMDERGLARVRLDSKGGMLICSDAGKGLVTVDMGAPRLDWHDIPLAERVTPPNFSLPLEGAAMTASAVSDGQSPLHPVRGRCRAGAGGPTGPRIETHPLFPNRINVEFAQVLDRGHIRMRVWERGVGITLACGTGACATAVAAIRKGLTDRKVELILDGGKLIWNGARTTAMF